MIVLAVVFSAGAVIGAGLLRWIQHERRVYRHARGVTLDFTATSKERR